MYNHKAHPPKMFLSLQIVAVMHHKPKNADFWARGDRKWVGGGPFCKIFKNCFKIFHIQQKKLISCDSMQFKFCKKVFIC